jgi:putative DNA primase/helicase
VDGQPKSALCGWSKPFSIFLGVGALLGLRFKKTGIRWDRPRWVLIWESNAVQYAARYERIFGALRNVRPNKTGWMACCPAHDDRNPSLSLRLGNNGDLLARCHAGCTFASIAAGLGISETEFFMDDNKQQEKPKKKFGESYDYQDENGKLLYQVVRWEPKGFSQRRPKVDVPKGRDDWEWNMEGVRRVLYHLPELVANRNESNPRAVWIVEGEKDVLSLALINLLATTNSGGAGKWDESYNEVLAGLRVFIIPDNDDPGHEHAAYVCSSLQGVAASVKIVELPGLSEKQDVSDWIAMGNGRDDLIALAQGKATAKPPAIPVADVTAQMVEYAEKLLELARKVASK